MMRKRLFWFTAGLATTGAAITHFSLRDLWTDFASLSYDLEQKFNNLETRVSNLEGAIGNNSTSQKDEGNLN
ncbi:unnamed protein product, partial [Vitis vinifera]|uniref:Uncharacterized protein n=1 Tax=Vitis vinifera TaxID=29760 RepID=D7SPW1_VITVI